MPDPDPHARPPNPSADDRPRTQLAMASMVCVVGALVARFGGLGESLWYDEIAAFRDHANRGIDALLTWGDPANHLLQSALAGLSVTTLGGAIGEEIALRLPSLLASLALVACAPWIARSFGAHPVFAGTRTEVATATTERDLLALLFALAAAFAPVLVLTGTEARGYPFMILGAALGLAGLDRAVAVGPTSSAGRIAAITSALAFTAGTWAHPMTAFAAFGACVALAGESLVARRARPIARGLIVLGPAGLLSLACYAPVFGELFAARGVFSNAGSTGPNLLGPEGADALRQLGGTWALDGAPASSLIAAPGWLAFLLGLAVAVRTGRGWIALRWLAGLPLAFAVLGLLGTWAYARFTLFAVPGGLLVAGIGVMALVDAARPRPRATAAVVVAVGTAFLAAWTADARLRPERQPLRWAAEVARDAAGPSGTVVVVGLRHRVMEAYLGDLGPRLAHALDSGGDGAAFDRAYDAADANGSVEAIVVLYPDLVPRAVYEAIERDAPHLERVRRRPGWIDQGRGAVEVRTRPVAPAAGADP